MTPAVTLRVRGSSGADLAPERALPRNLADGLASRHLAGLDGLRAVAAFLVVFAHAGLERVPAGAGVLAFFVLSGFLITRLMLIEEGRSGKVSLSQFYMRRSFRIFPAFYAYFALLMAIEVAKHLPIHLPQTISAFFYVSNYYQAIHGDPNTGLSHTWSLSVEEQFYLLWPLAFVLLRDNRRRFAMLAVGVPLLWVYREILIFGFHVDQAYIYEALDTRADHLLIGCLLAIALQEKRLTGLWRLVCSSQLMVVGTFMLLIAVMSLGWVTHITRYRDVVEFIAEPVLFTVLVVQLIAFPTQLATRPLNWRWVRFLGTISYSVYLYQQLVVHPTLRVFSRAPRAGGLIAAACVVTIAATGSYYLIERPFLRLRGRIVRSPAPN